MARASRSTPKRAPAYLLEGTWWDITTEEALALSPQDRRAYLVLLLTEGMS